MLNRITIIGRAGRDAEGRVLEDGTAVANITIATSETWKDKQGNKQEKTEWHNVQFWRGLAEVVTNYAKKGGLYYVGGRMVYRKWTDKEGVERISAEIVADEFKMLDKPAGAVAGNDYQAAAKPATKPAAAQPQPGEPGFVPDEDLPF